MRLIYIAGAYIPEVYPGVEIKIRGQLRTLEENGITTERINVRKLKRILCVMPFSATFDWMNLNIREADYLYFRKEMMSLPFIRMIKRYKANNPNARILMEIPTYPYDAENKSRNLLTRIRDKIYRRYLWRYTDRIVTFSEDDEIFGIKTIRIQNGIDVDSFPIVKEREEDNEIHLIVVAALHPHHGYERVIEGLKEYYENGGDRVIRFLIVGDGKIESELKELTLNYKLDDYVTFLGQKRGDELTALYNHADIGVCSFGDYKEGCYWSSALKTREYLARGLPMITASREDVFQNKNVDFCQEFENNSNPVDMRKVITFYEKTYSEGRAVLSKRIRAFAKENVDNRVTFMPVIQYVMGIEA